MLTYYFYIFATDEENSMKQDIDHNIGTEILPFVIKELVATIMTKKSLRLEDALYYLYSSKLYETLLDESTKMWYLSTLSLYDFLEKEKANERKRSKTDTDIIQFQIFCIEKYREKEKKSAKESLILFSKYDVFSFLEQTFDVLHTQDIDYILDSIAIYIKKACI